MLIAGAGWQLELAGLWRIRRESQSNGRVLPANSIILGQGDDGERAKYSPGDIPVLERPPVLRLGGQRRTGDASHIFSKAHSCPRSRRDAPRLAARARKPPQTLLDPCRGVKYGILMRALFGRGTPREAARRRGRPFVHHSDRCCAGHRHPRRHRRGSGHARHRHRTRDALIHSDFITGLLSVVRSIQKIPTAALPRPQNPAA